MKATESFIIRVKEENDMDITRVSHVMMIESDPNLSKLGFDWNITYQQGLDKYDELKEQDKTNEENKVHPL